MTRLTNRESILKQGFFLILALWPLAYNDDYALNVMVIAGIFAILAIGFTLLVGQARQVSLGHAAFFGTGAYTSAILTTKLGLPSLPALITGAVAAGVVAFFLGIPVLRLKGFILALVTMGLGEIFYVVAREARPITGGASGLTGIPWLAVGGFALDDYMRQYYAIWAIVLVLLLFSERAMRSRPGRAMRALAVSEATAATLGIHTLDWKLVAFVVSGIYAGIAGGLYAFVITAINPEDFGFALSIVVIIIVMLGGMGSLAGAVGGSILMTWLVRSFSEYQEYSTSIHAAVLILLVIFMPGGIAGGLRPDQKEWLRRLLSFRSRWWTPPIARSLARNGGEPDECSGSDAPDPRHTGISDLSVVLRQNGRNSANREPLLKLEGISVSFGGLQAVNQVSLSVPEGTIAALIGPNGAGKTTLFNTISGLQRFQSGQIWFTGREISTTSAARIARMGIARTFQSLHVFPNMSVIENVMVGRHRHEKAGFVTAGLGLPRQMAEEEESRKQALTSLSVVGLEGKAHWPVVGLPYGQQRLVEIARALATEPRLLLLDEPAAGLNTAERAQLMDRVARIRDTGVTVLLVEHDMDLVMGISDVVSVLDYGKLIAQGTPDEVQRHPAVIEAYLGIGHGSGAGDRRTVEAPRASQSQETKALLEVEGLSTHYGSICAIRDISLRVEPGEIVAVLGANGAGKTTLLHTISGALRPRNGRILFQEQDLTRLSAPNIVEAGIGHVPEGRHVFSTLTVEDNLRLGAYRRKRKAEIDEDFEFVYELFPVLKERRGQVAGTLSGGEQQMLAIGRALMGRPRLLLLDEPSMGLAPLIVELIFDTLVKLNRQGLTLLMVEQNAEMALSIAHHAFVLQAGRVALSGSAAQLRQDERVRGAYLGNKQARPDMILR